jgi:hypothetical protein
VEGKPIQTKKKIAEALKKWGKEVNDKPPATKNGRWGKNPH